MTDRIVLANMVFEARHGVNDREKTEAQRFEVDVELGVDVHAAGREDDLAKTVDYRRVYDATREIVEARTFNLIEALAEAIAGELLERHALVREVVVRVRKPEVRLGGPLDHASVEIRRSRGATGPGGPAATS
jgi:7,8-dihydroneopterin aldolase/epimerase/oxygenase